MDRLEGRGSSGRRSRSIIEDAAVTQVLLLDRHHGFLLAGLLARRLHGLLHGRLHGLSGRLKCPSRHGPDPRRTLLVGLALQNLDSAVKDLSR